MEAAASCPQPVTVFFSYAHEDEQLRNELAKHLSGLERQKLIRAWHDRCILPGQEWAEQIDDQLQAADVILLLISADFLFSKYCYEIEMKRALERHEAGEACVIPIILRPVVWKGTPFGKLQALPKNAKPVTRWRTIDDALENVTRGFLAAVEKLRARSGVVSPTADSGRAGPGESPGRDLRTDVEGEAAASTGAVRSRAEVTSASNTIARLAELVQQHGEVRTEATQFCDRFQASCLQLAVIDDHKKMHELLQQLQINSYSVIVDVAAHFPDEKSCQQMGRYQVQFAALVQRLEAVACRRSFLPKQVSWVQLLGEAREKLLVAVQDRDGAKLKDALGLMKRVLNTQPSKIATRLSDHADKLRLGDLARAVTAICDKAASLGIGAGKMSDFQGGARHLTALDGKLASAVREHSQWQEMDDDLGRIEDCLELDIQELLDSWPDVKAKMSGLHPPGNGTETDGFHAEGVKLDAAIAAPARDPRKIRELFGRYRTYATQRFFAADERLLELCDDLRVVAGPLNFMLNTLRANP